MHRRLDCLLLLVVAVIAATGAESASAGSSAPPPPAGQWTYLPGFDTIHLDEIHDLCWHVGELYATGRPTRDSRDPERPGYGVFVWRAGGWQAVRELENYGDWRLASDGKDLVAAQAGVIHRLHDGRWRRHDAQVRGPVDVVELWRGEVVMGGHLLVGREQRPARLVVYDGERSEPLGGDVGGVPEPRVAALLATEAGLWVAGRFEAAGRRRVANVARFDGRFWDDLDGGVDGEVTALAHHAGGVATAGAFARAGGQACDGLAAWRQDRWRALPAIPDHWRALPMGRACPTAEVNALAPHRDGLVAEGRFSFVDAAGDTARGLAVLRDDEWRQVPGADQLATPMRIQGQPFVRHEDTIEYLDSYHPHWQRRDWWWTRHLAAGRDHVAVGGTLYVAVLEDTLTVIASPYRRNELGFDLAVWRGDLLLLGPEMLAGRRLAGLGRLGDDGWLPLGDWTGTSLDNGGPVAAAVSWRDELVVAGEFHLAADQVVRHVARFDGQRWRPLGEGIPRAGLERAVLAPRMQDLVLVGDCRPGGMTAWRWDGAVWLELEPPTAASRSSQDWQIAAAADTVWAAVRQTCPHPQRAGARVPADTIALYALVDTDWVELGVWNGWTPTALAHRDGALYALGPRGQGAFNVLARWDGDEWSEVPPYDLPHRHPEQSTGPARLLDDGSVLLPGAEFSYRWDGAGWARWPGTARRFDFRRARLLDGRWYSLASAGSDSRTAVWDGPLPEPEPGFGPPQLAPIAKPRPWGTIRLPDLPPLATGTPTDSLTGWTVFDHGEPDPAPEVDAGERGRWRFGPQTHLTYRFRTPRPTWFRLTCRVSGGSDYREASLSLKVAEPIAGSGKPRWEMRGASLDRWDDGARLELLAPAVAGALIGTVSITSPKKPLQLQDLVLEYGDGFLVEALESLRQRLHERWRPPVSGGAVPAALPSDLAAAAARSFNAAGADSLALVLADRLGDDRIWVKGRTIWQSKAPGLASEVSEDELRQAGGFLAVTTHKRIYALPSNPAPCERLPGSVDIWLPGDLAYSNVFDPDPFGHLEAISLPDPSYLIARGLIIDLREPDLSAELFGRAVPAVREGIRGHRVLSALSHFAPGERWARVCDGNGKRHDWWRVRESHRTRELPLVLLVGPHTDGAHALLAEALVRLAGAHTVGEPTAPLPAWDEPVSVPWADWSLMVPAGTWEAPDGTTLTDMVIAPDVAWPADDIEGLLEQARRLAESARAGDSP